MDTTFHGLGLTALQAVRSPRAIAKLVRVLVLLFVTLPPAMVLLPWRQNVQAQGRVIALDPLDRTLVIPAPVTGRLVKLEVQEGAYVQKGQLLAQLADQDPQYVSRLEQQMQFMRDKFEAARGMVDFYDQQLRFLENSRDEAVASANFAVNVAVQYVLVAERELDGEQAELVQKEADYQRKAGLLPKGVVSELDFQKAEADFRAAQAKVDAGKAKVAQARNQEQGKLADVGKISAEQQAKIESTKSAREDARSKVAAAEKEMAEAATKFERQKTQTVSAPRTGYVLRVHAANSADLISQGDPLIELVPETDALAVELWVRGIDAPLVSPGREVRLQFEGWPAVQFAGWPSVAVGTFGGVVSVVDAQGDASGRFRVLVSPDPNDDPWPERRYLRQGVRTNGWLLLDTVKLGYEVWRQLNAFPPSVRGAPDSGGASSSKAKDGKSKSGQSKDEDGGSK